MRFRDFACLMLLGVGLLGASCAAHAADCITGQSAVLSLVEDSDVRAICGALAIRVRARDDPRGNVNIFATYPEFEDPKTPAERRYNEWIRELVGTMNFDDPLDVPVDHANEDLLAVSSLYRSPRLISASYSRWLCCGAHGMTVAGAINIDVGQGTLLSPGDLIDMGTVANLCWQQFS